MSDLNIDYTTDAPNRADGVFIDRDTGDLVVVIGKEVVGRFTTSGMTMSSDATITAAGVLTLTNKMHKNNGSAAIGYFDITGNTADTQTVTVGSRVYEFDTNSTITAGNVAVDISGGASATQSATALVAAINADTSRVCDAIDVGDGTVLLVTKAAGSTNHTLAETGTNIEKSGAACVLAAAAAEKNTYAFARTITAQDATTLNDANGTIVVCGVPATAVPTVFVVQAMSALGAPKACANTTWVWAQANTNFYVLKAIDAGAGTNDLVDTDVVRVIAIA